MNFILLLFSHSHENLFFFFLIFILSPLFYFLYLFCFLPFFTIIITKIIYSLLEYILPPFLSYLNFLYFNSLLFFPIFIFFNIIVHSWNHFFLFLILIFLFYLFLFFFPSNRILILFPTLIFLYHYIPFLIFFLNFFVIHLAWNILISFSISFVFIRSICFVFLSLLSVQIFVTYVIRHIIILNIYSFANSIQIFSSIFLILTLLLLSALTWIPQTIT
jgi:hypothetical protein